MMNKDYIVCCLSKQDQDYAVYLNPNFQDKTFEILVISEDGAASKVGEGQIDKPFIKIVKQARKDADKVFGKFLPN